MRHTLLARSWPPVTLAVVMMLWGVTAEAQPRITCNNNNGPITTYDFTSGATVGSFVPDGAGPNHFGRGVLVLGNYVYYAERSQPLFNTRSIHIAPFNGGAGGADIGSLPLPNPQPAEGVLALAFSNGVLYALTSAGNVLHVFGLDPITGAVVSGPVDIQTLRDASDSVGLTVLPNGNFLINDDNVACGYHQYDPSTGHLISGDAILVGPPGVHSSCVGVDTDGTSLYFQTNFNSFTKTDLAGNLIAHQVVSHNTCEDISLVNPGCLGAPGVTPGDSDCHDQCVSFLATTHRGMRNAADDLGFSSVRDLQGAIHDFCGD